MTKNIDNQQISNDNKKTKKKGKGTKEGKEEKVTATPKQTSTTIPLSPISPLFAEEEDLEPVPKKIVTTTPPSSSTLFGDFGDDKQDLKQIPKKIGTTKSTLFGGDDEEDSAPIPPSASTQKYKSTLFGGDDEEKEAPLPRQTSITMPPSSSTQHADAVVEKIRRVTAGPSSIFGDEEEDDMFGSPGIFKDPNSLLDIREEEEREATRHILPLTDEALNYYFKLDQPKSGIRTSGAIAITHSNSFKGKVTLFATQRNTGMLYHNFDGIYTLDKHNSIIYTFDVWDGMYSAKAVLISRI